MHEDLLNYHRLFTILPPQIRTRSVLLVGLGSAGSYIASLLARCGINTFTLVDPQCLEAGNVCRHELGYRWVGQPKVLGVAEMIRDYNPEAKVTTHQCDAREQLDLIEYLVATHDIVVACTDDFAIQVLLNDFALRHRTPITFGSCTERVEGGKVLLVEPESKLGCLCCATTFSSSPHKASAKPGEEHYTGLPWAGLPNFIHIIAAEQAWLTLACLAEGCEGNTLPKPPGPLMLTTFADMYNERGELVARANSRAYEHPRINPECPSCQKAGRTPLLPTIVFTPGADETAEGQGYYGISLNPRLDLRNPAHVVR